MMLLFSACSPDSLQNKMIGSWVNSSGYTIEFRTNGDGFIPGVAGVLADTSFKYSIVDESHVSITMNGQQYTIEIQVDNDKLTWKDTMGAEEYTRVKK
jgi:hypothetical protein